MNTSNIFINTKCSILFGVGIFEVNLVKNVSKSWGDKYI